MPTVADFVAVLEALAPPAAAADWDNVGLLAGDPTGPADVVFTCLTVTPDVVAAAVARGVQLVVSHHPVLFRGAKKLTPGTPDGRVLLPLLRAGIAVYSPHTAFDNAAGGVNDILCRRLGIVNAVPLRPRDGAKECKLVVFVLETDLAKVQAAVFAAGGGRIGAYDECSFRVPGMGTFFGTEAANPVVGIRGRREDVPEWRLEIVVPESRIPAAIRAMRAVHSYEEPAFDVIPLKPRSAGGDGRVGDLAGPISLAEFAARVKRELSAAAVQFGGDPTRIIRRAAVACGAAGEFLSDAARANADVFITGELRFHDALAAYAAGVAVVVPGHYATEWPAVEELAARLQAAFPAADVTAAPERDPLGGVA